MWEFSTAILQGFADLNRVRLEIITLRKVPELIPALLQGKADLAGPIVTSSAQAGDVALSAPILTSRWVVVNRKPRPAVRTIDQLRGEKLGVRSGTAAAQLLPQLLLPPENVVRGETFADIDLAAGKVTAVIRGLESALAEQHRNPSLQIGMYVGPAQNFAFAVPKDSVGLRSALDEYLRAIRLSGSWSRLVVTHYGEAGLAALQAAMKSPEP